MIFKNDWEKAGSPFLPQKAVMTMIEKAFPRKTLLSTELLGGGLSNTNFKLEIAGEKAPYLLRVYRRDPDAGCREQRLANLLKKRLPLPEVYRVMKSGELHFAVCEYLEGISLREVLLSRGPLPSLMFEVGTMLSRIHRRRFANSGFFDSNLKPIPHREELLSFAKNCLQHTNAHRLLGSELQARVNAQLSYCQNFLPNEKRPSLVHGDFDPNNILVTKKSGKWHISGLLDWEFAFSGSTLWDVANMLRYAHKMPRAFEASFIEGLKAGGYEQPASWRITTGLLNILSLLDCLVRSPPEQMPKRCCDIRALIHHYIVQLETKETTRSQSPVYER